MSEQEEARWRHPSRRKLHHMRDWPVRVVMRRGGRRLERLCPHGYNHPDPDWKAVASEQSSLHDCDGCCDPQRWMPTSEVETHLAPCQ